MFMPVLFAPVFMVILDIFIVNVAAPSLHSDLKASESEVQWVLAGYLLTYAISLITAGRLGDIFGRRRLFKLGVAGFTLASAICAAAPSAGALIAGRLLQGLAGAAMWPQVLSIIQVQFAPQERHRVFSIQGAIQGLASVLGQIVGGGLIALDPLGLSWRSVFLINVPVGALALLGSNRAIQESRAEQTRTLDIPGVALASLALTLIMLPAIEGRELGWPPWMIVALACAIPAAAAFVAVERRISARGGSPLTELRLFAIGSYRVGVLASLLLYCVPTFFLLLSLYLQEGLGLDALESGLAFTPLAVAFATGSTVGPRLGPRVREQLPQIGAASVAIGLIATSTTIAILGVSSVGPALLAPMLLIAGGMGTAVPPLVNLAVRDVPAPDAGAASGMVSTAQQIGNGLGVAIVGSVFFSALGAHTGASAYGEAFAIAMMTQLAIVTCAGALLALAHARRRGEAAAAGAGEGRCLPGVDEPAPAVTSDI